MMEYMVSCGRNSPPFKEIHLHSKKFTSIHDRRALEMNIWLQRVDVPERMTKGRTTLILKDPSKRTALNNYRPISCLPMMWKILTAQIREEIYYSLTSRSLFPDEQKECCKGSRGTAELRFISQRIQKESKTRRKNLWPRLITKRHMLCFRRAK